jgi:microcystin-dependent protein
MEPVLGMIYMFAGNFVPQGYAICDGQMLQISQNAALYSLLGTTYGPCKNAFPRIVLSRSF